MLNIMIKGGLGNQMFQYAFGLNLSKRLGTDIGFDTSFFDSCPYGRSFLLDKFIDLNIVKNTLPVIREGEEYRDGVCVEGYFQDYKFSDIDFNLKEVREEVKMLENPDAIGIHIRQNRYQPHELPFSYYEKAVKKFDGHFYIFSDDLEFGQRVSDLVGGTLISSFGLKDYEEWHLLKQCKRQIIANSTFSCWSAYSAEQVVCPEKWFVGRGEGMSLPNWIRC